MYKGMNNYPLELIESVKGFELDASLIAYEGWRRGLKLTYFSDISLPTEIDIEYKRYSPKKQVFALSNGNKTHYFHKSRGDLVSNDAVRIAKSKALASKYLKNNKVPTPSSKAFKLSEINKFITYARRLGYPVVLKPVKGSMGRGVVTNISNLTELKSVLASVYKDNGDISYIIEKHIEGKDYRFYVIKDRVISVLYRETAHVIGDGINSISALIQNKNNNRKKHPTLRNRQIVVDDTLLEMLSFSGLGLNTVVKKNQRVILKKVANVSAGADTHEVLDQITDNVKEIAVKAVNSVPGLLHAAVDLIIDQDNQNKATILELNPTANIQSSSFPLYGPWRKIPSEIIDLYFPETIENVKSNYFYSYNELFESLRMYSTESVDVISSPSEMDGYKYIYHIQGKSLPKGKLLEIQAFAIKLKIHGYLEKIDKTKYNIKTVAENDVVYTIFDEKIRKILGLNSNELIVKSKERLSDEDFVKIGFYIKE